MDKYPCGTLLAYGSGPVVVLVPLSSAYSHTKWSCDCIESTATELHPCPLLSL